MAERLPLVEWMILRRKVLVRDKFTCLVCGNKGWDLILEVDHIKPLSEGGTNDMKNLGTKCVRCHDIKSYGHITSRPTTFSERRKREYFSKVSR